MNKKDMKNIKHASNKNTSDHGASSAQNQAESKNTAQNNAQNCDGKHYHKSDSLKDSDSQG